MADLNGLPDISELFEKENKPGDKKNNADDLNDLDDLLSSHKVFNEPVEKNTESFDEIKFSDSDNNTPEVDSGFDESDSSGVFDGINDLEYESDDDDDDILKKFNLDKILSDAIDAGASDVYLKPYSPVIFKILDDVKKIDKYGIVTPRITERLHFEIISNVLEEEFTEDLELDASYTLRTGKYIGRHTRLNLGRTRGAVFMTFRIISNNIPTPTELEIPQTLIDWTNTPSGLAMVNGTTGTGKSTTIASLIRKIQLSRPVTIITIEKPIEYDYGNDGKALVIQREVGNDSRSFSNALTSAMRENPDVIVIGEVRDQVEVDALLLAAETGHFTISTMHTKSAAETITRIKALFRGEDQRRVLTSLADVSRGFANQVLVKTKDGKSRFAVREVLPIDDEVSSYIAKGDTAAIRDYQIRNKITMEDELIKEILKNRCSIRDAKLATGEPTFFEKLLKENELY